MYDEQLKMKRDPRQKNSLFEGQGLLFCPVSLFIFDRLSYVTA